MKEFLLKVIGILFLLVLVLTFDDLGNLVISILSLVFFILALYSIGKVNLRSYNIFAFAYFGGLFTSTFRLSIYQTTTELKDIYFYFVGPIIFILTLRFFEEIKLLDKIKVKRIISVEFLYICLLFIFVGIKLYIGSTLGWRIESIVVSDNGLLASGGDYTIPGISGLAAVIQWVLVILSPYVNRRYVIISIVSIIVLSGILHVKRGDIFRVFAFLFVWYTYYKLSFKSLSLLATRISILIVLLFIVFVKLGNLREEARGGGGEYLVDNVGISGAPLPLVWFYGYVSLNYEVLKHYYNSPPSYDPGVIRLLFVSEPQDDLGPGGYSINGFNASTFLSGFVNEFGYFYFVEMIVFGIIIGVLIYFIKSLDFKGAYFFLISMFILSFFGNYLASRSIFLSIVISVILFPFLKFRSVIN